MRECQLGLRDLSEEGFKVRVAKPLSWLSVELLSSRVESHKVFWVMGTAFRQPGIDKPKAGTWDEGVSWQI